MTLFNLKALEGAAGMIPPYNDQGGERIRCKAYNQNKLQDQVAYSCSYLLTNAQIKSYVMNNKSNKYIHIIHASIPLSSFNGRHAEIVLTVYLHKLQHLNALLRAGMQCFHQGYLHFCRFLASKQQSTEKQNHLNAIPHSIKCPKTRHSKIDRI